MFLLAWLHELQTGIRSLALVTLRGAKHLSPGQRHRGSGPGGPGLPKTSPYAQWPNALSYRRDGASDGLSGRT